MGQEASRAQAGNQQEHPQQLGERVQRVQALLAAPDQLERECNFQFQRSPLDSHGDMRRIEMRRLLWTFAHHLGSEDLTWEAIEVSAVVGTVDPHVPVVTQSEFFRCTYKTLHLVADELKKRCEKLRSEAECRAEQIAPKRPPPRAATDNAQDEQAAQSSEEEETDSEGDSVDEVHEEIPKREMHVAPAQQRVETVPLFSPAPVEPPPAPLFRSLEEKTELPISTFEPAPGGRGDETMPINGMIAQTLGTDGTFDPQRIFVGHGQLVLRDADEGGKGRHGFDLRDLATATTGETIAHSPFRNLLPEYVRDTEALNRMLALEFDEGEALCLWFSTFEDCERCLGAITNEARQALEASSHHGNVAGSAVSWMNKLFHRPGKDATR